MKNAGKYKHPIKIYSVVYGKDADSFKTETKTLILEVNAEVKTSRGMTLIKNGSDFEKAYTNFTIRYPRTVITRDMQILYRGIWYDIQYLNNIDQADVELEIQAKEVTH